MNAVGLLSACVAALTVLPAVVTAQAVSGRVVDASTNRPIEGVLVRAHLLHEGSQFSALSDKSGRFFLRLDLGGSVRLEAEALGYSRVVLDSLGVEGQEWVSVEVRLPAEPIEVESIRVVGRRAVPAALRDLYWRANQNEISGRGTVLVGAELRAYDGLSAEWTLVQQQYVRRSGRGVLMLKTRPVGFDARTECAPSILLNGLPVAQADLRSLEVSILEGIEVYRGPHEIPGRYLTGAGAKQCGIILLWTRPDW